MDLSKPQKFDTCRAQTLFLPIFVAERLYAVFDEVGKNSVWDKLV